MHKAGPTVRRLIGLAWLAAAALAHAQEAPSGRVLPEGLRIDDRRPEQPFTLLPFGVPVQFTGSWEYSDESRANFDLNDTRARDRRVRENEVELETRVLAGANTSVFLQAVGLYESRRTEQSGAPQYTHSFERGQSWVKFDRLGGTAWALQAGRVALLERRSWWWDDDLDALRLSYGGTSWRLDTGVARELARVSSAQRSIDPAERGVVRWFGQAGWRWARRNALELFWLDVHDRSGAAAPGALFPSEDDTDPSDLRARWIGLRASGEWRPAGGPRLIYWADGALLRGYEQLTSFATDADDRATAGATGRRRLRSSAFDVGATLAGPWSWRPSITAGFARGSGGVRDDTLDENFRQTGLQENKARFAGVKRLRVYGEVLQPELSNLAVTTVGTGVRFLANSSAELVWHRYRQIRPDTSIAGARLAQDPLGIDSDIGQALDLFFAVREWRSAELTLKLSGFRPGKAFPADRRDPAHAVEFGVALNF